jgi:hypothetical protein
VFNHTYYFLKKTADEKIVDARRAAVRDRLALTLGNVGHDPRRTPRALLARLLLALAGGLGRSRPALEGRPPRGHT